GECRPGSWLMGGSGWVLALPGSAQGINRCRRRCAGCRRRRRWLRAKTARSLVVSSLFVVTGIVAGITAGIVHQTAGAVAADIAAMRIEIGLAFLVELRRGVDGLIAVGIVHHAANSVAAIVT